MHINKERKALLLGYCRLLMTGVAALVISGLFMFSVHAADELVTEQPVVVVTGSGVNSGDKAYVLSDLRKIDISEYVYSTINTFPSHSVYVGRGTELKKILLNAGFDAWDTMTIKVAGPDGVGATFDPARETPNVNPFPDEEKMHVMGLGRDRYFYPNFHLDNPNEENKKKVEAILAWSVAGKRGNARTPAEGKKDYKIPSIDTEDSSIFSLCRLLIGQVTPNDVSNPAWTEGTKFVITVGEKTTQTIINVVDKSTDKTTSYTRGDLLARERAQRVYNNETVRGIPIKVLLSAFGNQTLITCKNNAGQVFEKSYTKKEMVTNNYMLAYEISDKQDSYDVMTDEQDVPVLMLYGDDLQEPCQVTDLTLDCSITDEYQSACNELDTYLNNDRISYQDYKPAQQQEIQKIIANAKAEMADAQSIDAIRTIKLAAMRKLDVIPRAEVLDATDIKRAKISLSKTSFIYTGKEVKPTAMVVLGGMTLKNGTQFKITYSANKAIGTAKAVITGAGEYWGSVTKTFTINPGKARWKKIKAGKKKLIAYYKSVGGGVAYQVQVRLGSGKWKTYGAGKKTIKTVKKLKSRKRYSVRVRAYRKVGGKTYYGSWSAIKKVRVK